MNLSAILFIVYNISLTLMLIFLLDILRSHWSIKRQSWLKFIYGFIIGLISIIIMRTYWEYNDPPLLDKPTIILSISGLLFGTIPTIIAMIVTVLFRIFQGGVGLIQGIMVIASSGIIGILWRYFYYKKEVTHFTLFDFWLLGMVVHTVLVLFLFTLPGSISKYMLESTAVAIITLKPVGTALLGWLMKIRIDQDVLNKQLKEERRILKVVSENSKNWEYWLDKDLGFIYCSESCLTITGYTRRNFLEDINLLEKIIYPEDKDLFNQHSQVYKLQQAGQIDFRIVHKDGSIRWIHHSCLPIYDEKGKFIGTRGSNSDITYLKDIENQIRESKDEINQMLQVADQSRYVLLSVIEDQKESQEKLTQLNEKLENKIEERTALLIASNKELEAFSYSVSHDLRAPLRGINGFVDILVDEYGVNLDDEGKRICNVIKSSAQKMGQLIDDLLSFSRITRQEIKKVNIDMTRLADSVFHELTDSASGNNIDFRLSPLHECYGDQAMIRQVIVNLLTNAIKYSSKKEFSIIGITSERKKRMIIYRVTDNGVGFNENYKNKLFNVFQRLHSDQEFSGTGVGLAIVQRIIAKHNGQVGAVSKAGEGATFWFSIPDFFKD